MSNSKRLFSLGTSFIFVLINGLAHAAPPPGKGKPSGDGGLYCEMFPARAAVPDCNGKIPLETSGADILGQTSTERILAEACEWAQPGSGVAVFPNAASSDIKIPGMLDNLFS